MRKKAAEEFFKMLFFAMLLIRSVLSTFVISEISFLFQIGSVLAYYISGLLLSHYDWPVVFFFWGIVSIIWVLVFVSFFFLSIKVQT